jgi:hypothetical protein
MCTRFLHACSALCKCANWLFRTYTPHRTVAGRSSVSLTQSPFAFPSNCRCGPPLTSYMPGRAVPSRARVHGTAAHIIAHCAPCTACAPLFWDMKRCSPSSFNRRFGGTYRLHLKGRRNKFSKKPASKQVASLLQGVISQKMILFITTAVKTSNPT